jgi:hypothetical protein
VMYICSAFGILTFIAHHCFASQVLYRELLAPCTSWPCIPRPPLSWLMHIAHCEIVAAQTGGKDFRDGAVAPVK